MCHIACLVVPVICQDFAAKHVLILPHQNQTMSSVVPVRGCRVWVALMWFIGFNLCMWSFAAAHTCLKWHRAWSDLGRTPEGPVVQLKKNMHHFCLVDLILGGIRWLVWIPQNKSVAIWKICCMFFCPCVLPVPGKCQVSQDMPSPQQAKKLAKGSGASKLGLSLSLTSPPYCNPWSAAFWLYSLGMPLIHDACI